MLYNTLTAADLQALFAQSEVFAGTAYTQIEQMVQRGGFKSVFAKGTTIAALGSHTYRGPWYGYGNLGLEIPFPAVLLHSLIVSKEYRRRGIAANLVMQQLVAHAARLVDGKQLEKVYTFAANPASHTLFKRIGFVEIVTDPENGIFMSTDLAEWR